jgi:hypothetical protein
MEWAFLPAGDEAIVRGRARGSETLAVGIEVEDEVGKAKEGRRWRTTDAGQHEVGDEVGKMEEGH